MELFGIRGTEWDILSVNILSVFLIVMNIDTLITTHSSCDYMRLDLVEDVVVAGILLFNGKWDLM